LGKRNGEKGAQPPPLECGLLASRQKSALCCVFFATPSVLQVWGGAAPLFPRYPTVSMKMTP